MKKILSLLLAFVLLTSFCTLCCAAAEGEYLIVFSTKTDYGLTAYKNVFSDHRNFISASAYGIDGITDIEIIGAFYSDNPHLNPPYYVLCLSTDAATKVKADLIALEIAARGIAYLPKVIKDSEYADYLKELFGADFSIPEDRLISVSKESFGDIDCTGEATANDARTALRIAVGLEKKENYPYLLGDTDHDGEITASDAREILRISVGLSGFTTTD